MNVLIACEYSGTVRDAFENTGFNAWSCDIIPTESEQTQKAEKHFEGDVFEILDVGKWRKIYPVKWRKMPEKWDLLIGFPPCTYLSFAYTGASRYSIERLQKKIEAYQFFLDLWNAPVEHICLENPLGYVHSGLLPYSQIVEPYFYGDAYKKKTCLWLKNLPKLTYTETGLFGQGTKVEPANLLVSASSKKKPPKLPELTKMYESGKNRAKFHTGIAGAMAEQWGGYLKNKYK